ncbi:bifunctional glycosyltransferase family 2/GtrA family protein [Microbacterium oryzae]|uniref:bifunctional glycosyltransferase family 2/GtrA family protein n=1 Tax=Microbacterium oryzae TaxID=743009 RepID=UPI0025B0FA5B|nr:bifunctional glycosyltransferase family 2/GtrA family protein [Microbacterium oryzae]MDN3311558.1 bifunctional glycosyltransferase family 2/GtrA family protein [Microbacterium oryzae]
MTVVAIPAYEPDHRLADLAAAIRRLDPDLELVVVDDGSGVGSAPVFASLEAAGVTVLTHGVNRGKGSALRTLFRHARARHPGAAVVTADADGQHAPDDIVRVAREVESRPDAIVLGVRAFDGDDVPLRSRFGNAVAARAFALVTGARIADTQTGLRGIPADALPWAVGLPGDRFEYEAVMLLRARRAGFALAQTPIATVYLDENRSSHFRPLRDSARVLAPLAAFLASSLLAAAVDAALLWVLLQTSGWLQGAIVLARLVSATVNFLVNRRWVFGRDRRPCALGAELGRYAALATAILAANVMLMTLLDALGVGLIVAKLATEGVLWVAAFAAQRVWVFARGKATAGSVRPWAGAARKPHVLA